MFALDIVTPEGSARVPLQTSEVRVGRTNDNDVVLAFPQISRHHAEMRLYHGNWWIADFGSTNGVYIAGEKIKMRELRHGDIIDLAPNISMRLVDLAHMPAQAAPPQSALPYVAPAPPAGSEPYTLPADYPMLPAQPQADRPDPAPASAPYGSAAQAWATASPTLPGHEPVEGGGFGEAAPATWQMLSVCPHCGQSTLAMLPLCTHCHQSLASPCATCGNPVLPMEPACPRCNTPNANAAGASMRGGW